MSGVVVGVDGSRGAQRALEWALAEAGTRGETLRVLYAYAPPALPGDGGTVPASEDIRHEAEALVARMAAEAGAADAPIQVVTEALAVREHSVARALVQASKGASMLVVGSRGLEGFAGLLMGSVSQQCVQHALCPVVVVPTVEGRSA